MGRKIKLHRLMSMICMAIILSSCNSSSRPIYGSATTRELDTYGSFTSYIAKQDTFKKSESFPLFDFTLDDAISTKYYIEGIDITGQYEKEMSKEDYNDESFYVFMHRYCYINNFFDDGNFLILGFSPFKDLTTLSISGLNWVDIYGNIYDRYGTTALGDHDTCDYFTEATSKDREFFMYNYIDEVNCGVALRNDENISIIYLFTNASSFDYLDAYKTIALESVIEVLKNV